MLLINVILVKMDFTTTKAKLVANMENLLMVLKLIVMIVTTQVLITDIVRSLISILLTKDNTLVKCAT